MLSYSFLYNVPADNNIAKLPNAMIKVLAKYVAKDLIAFHFPEITASEILFVKDWFKAIEDMEGIAKVEFEMMTAISYTEKLLTA